MDAKSKRGCLWAALGAIVLVLLVGAALFGGAAWLVYQSSSITSSSATPQRASEELAAVRSRFAGQAPLIAIDEHEQAHIVRRKATGDAVIDSLHVLAFEPRENRLRRISVPFWVVRLSPGSAEVKMGHDTFRLRGEKISVEDIEAAGPGLLVDHEAHDGSVVLVWTE